MTLCSISMKLRDGKEKECAVGRMEKMVYGKDISCKNTERKDKTRGVQRCGTQQEYNKRKHAVLK